MRYASARLAENVHLESGYFVLRLEGAAHLDGAQPGQFVMLRGDWGSDPLLPRAFSLLRVAGGDRAEILVKALGKASRLFERLAPGSALSVLGPLGTGFPPPTASGRDLLVAGGVGLAPLLMYAEHHRTVASRLEIVYGARTDRDLVLLSDIEATGAALHLATEDGSRGQRGRVTLLLERRLDALAGEKGVRLFACGPNAMLDAVRRIAEARQLPCYVSLEGEMACGVGACLVCAVAARSKPFRYVCKDGPVLDAADLK